MSRTVFKKLLHNRYTHKYLWEPIHRVQAKDSTRHDLVRHSIFDAEPIRTSVQSGTTLGIFTFPRDIHNACWVAYSLLKRLPEIDLTFLLESKLQDTDLAAVKKLFPSAQFVHLEHVRELMLPTWPSLIANFADRTPVGRKLMMLLFLQSQMNVLYSDSDVLCFGKIPEVCHALSVGHQNLYVSETSHSSSFEPVAQQALQRMGLTCAPFLNSGFLYLRKQSLDTDVAEHFFRERDNFDLNNWWVEQTVLAALIEKAGATPLPKERYLVSPQGQWIYEIDVDYRHLAIRHFVSPIRWLMYTKGMPLVKRQLSASFASPRDGGGREHSESALNRTSA